MSRMAALSTMFRTVNLFTALSLGTHREQFEQRTKLLWPRPFLLRPEFLRFLVCEKAACGQILVACRANVQGTVSWRVRSDEEIRLMDRTEPSSTFRTRLNMGLTMMAVGTKSTLRTLARLPCHRCRTPTVPGGQIGFVVPPHSHAYTHHAGVLEASQNVTPSRRSLVIYYVANKRHHIEPLVPIF